MPPREGEPEFSSHHRNILENLIKSRGEELDFDKSINDADGVEVIKEASDLPDPVDGLHPLEPMTAYYFDGFIASESGLQLAPSTPLISAHGSSGGFIHVGGQTALVGDGVGYFAKDVYIHAPGGTIYDLSADRTSEMLVESISHSDAAGMGNIADLGVVDGFRVPTWKGCNFENFDAGLTLTGRSDKIFISTSPLRSIDAAGVTILELDANFETDLVDIANSYVKGVQPDTEVLRVDPGAVINDQLQYRGTVHDSTVSRENIFNGAMDRDSEPYTVSDAYPAPDTSVYINWGLDSSTTTVIDQQAADKSDGAAYEMITGNVTIADRGRFEQVSGSQMRYLGRKTISVDLQAFISAGTGVEEPLAIGFFRNGNLLGGTVSRFLSEEAPGNTGIAGSGVASGVIPMVEQNDTISARVANTGSTNDIDISELSGKISRT